MHKSLAMKPSDESAGYVNAIGSLLNKTLPNGWKRARICASKTGNIIEWKGYYSLGGEKTVFKLNENFITNIERLRNGQKYLCPMSEIIFFSNNQYEIKYQVPEVKRLSVNKIQEAIGELKKLDLEITNIDSLKKCISTLTIGYTLKTPKIPAGRKLYRGILWQEKPYEVSKLSYPPKEMVSKFHRAGRPNQSLFYCSSAREAVFYELGVCAGDKLVVAEWETTDSLFVNNVGFDPDTLKKLGSNRDCLNLNNEKLPEEFKKHNKLVRQFFSNEFTRKVHRGQEHLYKISVAIAEQHFQSDMFDALLYPAIAMKGKADNLAIKPQSISEKLVLKKAEYIQVTDDSNDGYKMTMLDFANSFSEDGWIEWKGRLPHWVLRNKGDQLVTVENSKWVARNTDGEVVEPE